MLAVQAGISQMTTPREESAKLVEKFTHNLERSPLRLEARLRPALEEACDQQA
jgi:hypothetical protein